MKSLALLFALIIPIFLNSQPCLPDGITFTTQEEIDNFQTNYPDCSEIEGDVVIQGNSITNLNGLSVLTSIGGELYILSTTELTSLTGLENVTTIGGSLSIEGNHALTTLTGLDNLTSIEGNLYIYRSASLTSLSGLDNLTSIGGNLSIGSRFWGGNDSLTSLTGLDKLTSIGGFLGVSDNDALTSLTGLENVTSIGGFLWIESNAALTSLTGLDNIYADTIPFEDLSIFNNNLLSTCEVQSICDYLVGQGGIIEIYNNATGCNSRQEVKEACEASSVDEISFSNTLKSYPNPFTTSTTIEYELNQPETVTITYYNQFGKQVNRIEQKQSAGTQQVVWAPDLPGGVYYFRLEVGEMMSNGKVVLIR